MEHWLKPFKNRLAVAAVAFAAALVALIPVQPASHYERGPIAQTIERSAALYAAQSVANVVVAPVHAAALTDNLENSLIDWFIRGQAFTPPATVHVGLLTAACSDSAAGTEVSGGSYARVAVTSSLANWAGTQSAGSTTASSGSGGTTSNNGAITFPAPTANWGTVTHFGLYTASSGGTLYVCAALTNSKTVNNGDAAPSFAAAALTLQIDN